MRRISTIFFDLDGTLTDSKPGIIACIQHALHSLDLAHLVPADLDWCIGPPIHESFATLLQTKDLHVVDRAIAAYRERYGVFGKYENSVFPGVHEMLRGLAERGYQLLVATSKPTLYARDILDHFELLPAFVAVYGSELSGQRSNKAELIRHILEQEQLEPMSCLMIGDRRHDIVGAKANGVRAWGITYGYGTRLELAEAGADAVFEHPHEVLAALR